MGSALVAKLGEIAASGAAKIKGLFSFGGGSQPATGGMMKPIEARAKGGPVMGGKTYIVGERGPELFRAPTSGEIVPNHRLQRLTSPETIAQATRRQGRSVTIGDTNVTVSITTQGDPEAIAKAAARAVSEQILRMKDEQHAHLSD